MNATTIKTITNDAVIFTATNGENSVPLVVPKNVDKAVATEFSGLCSAVNMFCDNANIEHKRLQAEAFKSHLLGTTASVLSPMYRSVQAAGIKADQSRAAAETRAVAWSNDPAPMALRAEDRANMRGMDHAELAQAITTADLPRLQAVLERPDGFPPQFVEIARERAMRLSFIKQSGIQADYALTPTAADPLAHGPDVAAAERAADVAMAKHAARRETVNITRNLLRETVYFVAVAAGVDRERAFAALMGRTA